ncbi:DNA polymerase [Selenomonas sp. CM52]|uniref:DNA polymerase n=1 Tax=Selenomonas sp. CM52 TaxID=936381 RepID=UPI00027C4400|nr:DNA polymerase [Selenomonas sp. CM52]EJU25202.1 DNA-directed DNA polymerase domain protein [Selenomonas sp. CM52]
MNTLSIDVETFSDVDISKCGAYKYAESPSFEILLFSYAADAGEVQVVDLANGEQIPQEILDALLDDNVIKWAFNANFERVCLSRYLSDLGFLRAAFLSPESWRCTMVWAAYMGLPLSLAAVGSVLGLEEQKMTEGKALIRFFCSPCAATKANSGRTRNLPCHAPDKWALFKAYNKRDVEVEMAIQQRLAKFPVPDFLWDEYHLDQEINDHGIRIDMELVDNAIAVDARSREELTDRMKRLTGLDNPNSVQQMKGWLSQHGMETDSLDKKAVLELLKNAPPELSEALSLRQQLAKSSVRKYIAMKNVTSADHRARGTFRFYGANRTGRFSSKNIQLQNLPQNHLADIEYARALVRQSDFESLNILYDSVPDVLSQLIRTAFIPKEGRKFIVADFSAIEARVLSWLAKEQWRMDVFANDGDIYCATAGRMFHCNVVKHGENGHLRQKGKQAELACGYGGSVGALKAFGALESGMKEDELKPLVDAWRAANPHIVDFWWAVDRAAKDCIKERSKTVTHGIQFICQSGMIFIELPSGRRLAYAKPRIGENKFGGESITYMGLNTAKKWVRIESYGPKLVENITQAISRDILCYAMQTLKHMDIVAHVHDEIIIECEASASLSAVCEQMARTPPWAKGLLLRADGFECEFYQKD